MARCSYQFKDNTNCEEPALDGGKGLCVFHDDEAWKTHADEIRNKVLEKLERGDNRFEGYHFPKIEIFKARSFENLVDFIYSTFFDEVDFSGSKFLKEAFFDGANFMGKVKFNESQFSDLADFLGAKFTGRADFWGTRFSLTIFCGARFLGGTYFVNAKFTDGVDFSDARFSDEVWFRRSSFYELGLFRDSQFYGIADFIDCKFFKVDFFRAMFRDIAKFDDSRGYYDNNIFWEGNFTESIFEKKATFSEACLDARFTSTSMNDSTLRDTIWPNNGVLYEEREADASENNLYKIKMYYNSVKTYFFIKTRMHAEGDYKDESNFFFREKRTEMKLLKARLRFKPNGLEAEEEATLFCDQRDKISCFYDWLFLTLSYIICGFGERILHILGTFLFTWVFFAFGLLLNIVSNTQERLPILIDGLYISLGALSNLGYDQKVLVFSITEFGYWLVQTESLVGIILISLFLVVFVRKMSRQ